MSREARSELQAGRIWVCAQGEAHLPLARASARLWLRGYPLVQRDARFGVAGVLLGRKGDFFQPQSNIQNA